VHLSTPPLPHRQRVRDLAVFKVSDVLWRWVTG